MKLRTLMALHISSVSPHTLIEGTEFELSSAEGQIYLDRGLAALVAEAAPAFAAMPVELPRVEIALSDLSLSELKALAHAEGIDFGGARTKAEIIVSIESVRTARLMTSQPVTPIA